ncbi:hypothetical protein D3C83_237420 [compost metagenome]
MADEHGALALLGLDLAADLVEQPAQGFAFVERRPQRIERIDTGDLERCRLQIRALEWLDQQAVRFT